MRVIITGTSRSDWRKCAKRIMRARKNESARLVEITGLGADDIPFAFRIMHGFSLATQCENFFYHASISPRAHELLTERQWEQAVDILGRHLGLVEQPRIVVERVQNGRIHRQVVWLRIDLDRMKAIPDAWDYSKQSKAARELEELFGLEPAIGRARRTSEEVAV